MTAISRILVPFDFSACGRAALEYAAALADRLGAHVEIVHVWDPGAIAVASLLAEGRGPFESLDGYVAARVTEEVTALTSALPYRSLRGVRGRAVSGSAVGTILRIAEDEDFQLIVMGTHGRKGIAHALLGSVAEQVVRRAPCPVLTIGDHGREATTRALTG